MTARTDRQAQAAGIAGICFLIAFVGIPPLAYATTLIRVYGPGARDWLVGNSVGIAYALFAASLLFALGVVTRIWIDRA